MNRRSLIKNMMGAIVGYALLPKMLTETVPEPVKYIAGFDPYDTPGLGGSSFTIKITKGMFHSSDIIQMSNSKQYYLTRNDKNELIGKSLTNGDNEYLKLIEIEQQPVDYEAEYLTYYKHRIHSYSSENGKIDTFGWDDPIKVCSVLLGDS